MFGVARKVKINLLDIKVSPMIMGIHPSEIGIPHQLKSDSEEFKKIFQVICVKEVIEFLNKVKSKPQTAKEERIRKHVRMAEKMNMSDFRRPILDPSFLGYRWEIVYYQGSKPAVGRTPEWWEQVAIDFMPEKNSRLSDDLRNDVFLTFIVKELVEKEKYKMKEAWKAVCVDSKNEGNFYDSKNSRLDFEKTGSRQIGEFFDLGNTVKILKSFENSEEYVLAGGSINYRGRFSPLATIRKIQNPKNVCEDGVGVIITDV